MLDNSEEQRVKRDIIDVVASHYDLIAQSQEANRRVEAVSRAAQVESSKLRESLIKLEAQSKSVLQAGGLWRRKKQVLGSAVVQHQKLLALAEAPALVEECVRGEMYHEALLVMEHVLRSSRYAQESVGFFVRANAQMREALERSLEEVVLPRLSGPLSVDAAFKIATFLRRIGTGTDRLRTLFLERRGLYIDRLVAEADSSPLAYSQLLRHIAVYKVDVSEVVMQYCACFPDDGHDAGAGEAWDAHLRLWCHTQSARFVAAVAAAVQGITNGTELALIVKQTSSCASSVAKLHTDVAPLLGPLLLERVGAIFALHMAHALSAYTASMRTFAWRMPPSYLPGSSAATTTAASVGGGAEGDAASTPPLELARWLPLAYALNGLLAAFNAVRKCLLPGVELPCVSHVACFVARIAADLLRDGELASTMEEAERDVYKALVTAFVDVFYPHVLRCTRQLLGADATGWLDGALADAVGALRHRLPAAVPSQVAALQQPPAPAPAVSAAPVATVVIAPQPQPNLQPQPVAVSVVVAPALPVGPVPVAAPSSAPPVAPQLTPQCCAPPPPAMHNPFANSFAAGAHTATPAYPPPQQAPAAAGPPPGHPNPCHGGAV